MDNLTLIMITLFLICAGLIIGVLNFVQSKKNKKIKKTLENLEIEKNKLATSPIVPELAKVENFLSNEKLQALYDEWSNRLKQIKEVQIPKLSDMILDAEYSLSQMDYKSTMYKIAKLEGENSSLDDWKKAHRKYFKQIYAKFKEDTKVIFEIFEVVKKF